MITKKEYLLAKRLCRKYLKQQQEKNIKLFEKIANVRLEEAKALLDLLKNKHND